MRVALIFAAAILPVVASLTLTNCTQQVLSVPGPRAAASVQERFAVFAFQAHSDSNNSGLVDIFDSKTKRWSQSRFSASRTNMCSTSWKHLAIFAGGSAGRGLPKSPSVDVWDSTTNTWTVQQLQIGRDLCGCASAGNVTIFAGGSAPQANQSETATVEIWNHVTNQWTHANLSQPRKKPEAVAVGTKIVIAGGEIAKPPHGALEGYSATVDVYDSETGEWTTDKLLSARQYFGAAHASGKAVGAGPDGVAVFAGGFYNDIRLGSVDIYDPIAKTHQQGQDLSHNRSNLHACSAGHGRYAAFGSGNIDATAKISLDFYDGETGDWAHTHTHTPIVSNGVASVGNVVMFMGFDGRADTIALDGDCSVVTPNDRVASTTLV